MRKQDGVFLRFQRRINTTIPTPLNDRFRSHRERRTGSSILDDLFLTGVRKGDRMAGKTKESRNWTDSEGSEGATSRIRAVVKRSEPHDAAATMIEQIRAVKRSLKKQDRRELTEAALAKYFRSEMLKPYQAELIKLQQHLERTHKKSDRNFLSPTSKVLLSFSPEPPPQA